MRKGFVSELVIGLMAAFLIFCALFYFFSVRNIPDRLVINKIPRYQNSISWRVSDSAGIIYSNPNASIRFKTADTTAVVINHYRQTLGDLGWTSFQRPDFDLTYDSVGYWESFRKGDRILGLSVQTTDGYTNADISVRRESN